MSTYAYAVLDALGAEPYNGNKPDVLRLITDLKDRA